MLNLNWYRNASEKDQEKPQGSGTLMQIFAKERTGETIVLIMVANGDIVEKIVSLVRVVKENIADGELSALKADLEARTREYLAAKEADESTIKELKALLDKSATKPAKGAVTKPIKLVPIKKEQSDKKLK